jgi:hypothetical protein
MSALRSGPIHFPRAAQRARRRAGRSGGFAPRAPHLHLRVEEFRRDLDSTAITRSRNRSRLTP